MLPTKALFSLLAAYASLASTAAVPAAAASPEDKVLVFEGPFPMNTTLEGPDSSSADAPTLSKRAVCLWSGSNIYIPDINEMVRQLQNDWPDQLKYLPARSYASWTWGAARICAQNWYYADNTHIKRWEAGWAANEAKNHCCPGGPSSWCGGGKQQAHGDSGLPIDIVVRHSSSTCYFSSSNPA
ncbi:MAG: hypothetical protein Q9226_002435 [Calogaya cf. arnoldii]